MNVKIQKVHPGAHLPEYKTVHSAGADIYACLSEPMILKPGDIKLVPTGFCMELPEGFEAQIRPRSGLGAKGISVPNAPGTIDSDYRGEVKVILINLSREDYTIHHEERIAQMVIAPVVRGIFVETDSLNNTERGAGGFGSTGRHG